MKLIILRQCIQDIQCITTKLEFMAVTEFRGGEGFDRSR
jgi:hypothetical protein